MSSSARPPAKPIGIGSAPVPPATYDTQDRLSARGATTDDWTAAGFLAGRGADDFSYSDRGELLEADLGGGPTVTYRSDAYGRRVARVVGGDATRYLYGNPSDPFQVSTVRGTVARMIEYDAFGRVTVSAGSVPYRRLVRLPLPS